MRSNSEDIKKWMITPWDITMFIGVGLLIGLMPFLFTRRSWWISFTETGEIGDTIGGITAPFIGILSSILVYRALKAQIDANKIITAQFKQQKQIANLLQRLAFIREDIDKYTFTTYELSYKNYPLGEEYIPEKHDGLKAILTMLAHFGAKDKLKAWQWESTKISYNQFSHLIADLYMLTIDAERGNLEPADIRHIKGLVESTFLLKLYPAIKVHEHVLDKRVTTFTEYFSRDIEPITDHDEK